MTKSLATLITFTLFITVCLTQDCNNPLLARFNLTALSAPQSGSGLQFCENLQNGQTCCSAATVSSFQGLLNNLLNDIQTAAGDRDTYLTSIRNDFSVQYQNLFNTLESFDNQIPSITAQNNVLGNNITNETFVHGNISESLNSINDDFSGALTDYQNVRAQCLEDLLQVQLSAWCLACDPNYANNGVRPDGTIVFSNDLINEISENCYPYLEAAERFNPLIRARQAFVRLQNLTTYVTEFANTNVIANTILIATSAFTGNATEDTVTIPTGCTGDDSCPWQANNLFNDGLLNQTLAANGAGILGAANVALAQLGTNDTNSSAANNTVTGANNVDAVDNDVVAPAVQGAAVGNTDNTTNSTNATTDEETEVVTPAAGNLTVANIDNTTNPESTADNDVDGNPQVVAPAAGNVTVANIDNTTNPDGSANDTTGEEPQVVAPAAGNVTVANVDNSTNAEDSADNADNADTDPLVVAPAAQNLTVNNNDAEGNNRLLQNAAQSTWNPNLGNNGLTIDVAADPANQQPIAAAAASTPAAAAAAALATVNPVEAASGSILALELISVASLTMVALM